MTKRYPIFSLLGAFQNFHATMSFKLCTSLIINNLILAKFSFLAVSLNLVGKLCRLSHCMYISQNSSKTILKQNNFLWKIINFYGNNSMLWQMLKPYFILQSSTIELNVQKQSSGGVM